MARGKTSAINYIPTATSKVRKSWYTRRDVDGRTILMQVEEGVEESEKPEPAAAASQPKSRAGSVRSKRCSEEHGKLDSFESALKAKMDPFHHVLQEFRYIHPNSHFMRYWQPYVVTPISAYFVLIVPLRLALPRLWPTLTMVRALAARRSPWRPPTWLASAVADAT